MAENVVLPLLSKLNELISTKLGLIWSVDIKIFSLRNKLAMMQAFLKYADAERRDNEMIKIWVDQGRDVAFRAEDAIDRHMYEVQYQRHSGFVGSVKTFANRICRLKPRYELGVEIAEISQMLQEISASKSEFGIEFKQSPGVASPSLYHSKPKVDIEEANVVGLEEDKKVITENLLTDDQHRCLVSIVGMGGLGKTTLARNIYNDNDVNKNFDCQTWISVSQKYRKQELLQTMVQDLMKLKWEDITKMDERTMVDKLKAHLNKKKYLLVIDDIWEAAAWEDISSSLPDENNGSRIMITTRNKEVVQHIDPHGFIHELQCLDEKESWNLFCSKVFGNKDGCPSELEYMREEIVAKCAGLRLTIVVLGGLLLRKPKLEIEWKKVLKHITYELHESTDGKDVRRILACSYDDLPYYLRSCFLYLGLFPKGSEIDVEKLVQLWVAEGFVQQKGEETMEEVAEEYLEELVNKSMIQVVERNSWGRVITCRVHDLLSDLAISQSKEDRFLGIITKGDLAANYIYTHSTSTMSRRVAVHHTSVLKLYTSTYPHSSSQSSLRSLLNFDAEILLSQVRLLINNLNLLRVLDLSGAETLKKLPKEIGSMIHLRFLGLEYTDISKLPSSIGNLHNLQTLLLDDCWVPPVIWKIKTLRHVSGDEIKSSLAHCSCKGGLQTLWGISSRSLVGTNIHEFTNLRKLGITGSSSSRMERLQINKSRAKLTRLNKLALFFLRRELRPATKSADGVSPRFPPSLTEIELFRTQLSKQDLSAVQRLPNLKILSLWNNTYADGTTEMVFSADGFKKLQELYLIRQEQLEWWIVEEGAMPSLRHLTIGACGRLKKVPKELQHITTLQKLEIWDMGHKFAKRLQKETGADWHKVQHIPSVIIN